MRKIILIITLFLISFGAEAQRNGNYTLEGTLKIKNVTEIIIYSVENGEWVKKSNLTLNADGKFKTELSGDEGIWGIQNGGNDKNYIAPFYAKKRDKITISIEDKWNIDFGDKITPENKIFSQWNKMRGEVFGKRQTLETLFPRIDRFIVRRDSLIRTIKTGNKYFNDLMPFVIYEDYRKTMFNFLHTPTPTILNDQGKRIYSKISHFDFADARYLKIPDLIKLISMIGYHVLDTAGSQTQSIYVDNIKNEIIKGLYWGSQISTYKSYDFFAKDYEKYSKYLTTEKDKNAAQKYIAENKKYSAGEPAIDFTYPDMNGKSVSLSDFKGKVVVVDVWATWCAPCKMEIPHFKKLEEEFEDNANIVFISVTIDVEKDKQEWINMIREKQMSGIQLFANGGRDLMSGYNIKGIPRFMVFGKDGKIVSTAAPRPSDPALKEMIKNVLK